MTQQPVDDQRLLRHIYTTRAITRQDVVQLDLYTCNSCILPQGTEYSPFLSLTRHLYPHRKEYHDAIFQARIGNAMQRTGAYDKCTLTFLYDLSSYTYLWLQYIDTAFELLHNLFLLSVLPSTQCIEAGDHLIGIWEGDFALIIQKCHLHKKHSKSLSSVYY